MRLENLPFETTPDPAAAVTIAVPADCFQTLASDTSKLYELTDGLRQKTCCGEVEKNDESVCKTCGCVIYGEHDHVEMTEYTVPAAHP